jgi:hypothetical protein
MLNVQCSSAPACTFNPFIHTPLVDTGRGAQAGAAGTVMEAMSFRKLVQWIREEFEAAPDLRLTTREAAAFLGLDLATAERVLGQLFRSGFLRRGADDRYGVAAA